jgi:predicted RND superfamily exporter protein
LKIFEFLANQSEKRPWLVLIAVALITVFLLAGIPRLSTELSQEAMMPKNYESVQSYKAVKEKFGGISYQTVLVTADDVTDPEMVRVLFDLSPEKTVEAGIGEGQVLKVETYLDFLKYQLPEMMKAAGMDVSLDLSAISDAMLAQFMDFYLNPDPASPFLEAMTSLSGTAMSEETKRQFISVFTDNSERIKKNFIRGEQDGNPPYVAMLVNFQINPNLSQNQLVELGKKFKDFIAGEFGGMKGVETYIMGNASQQMESQEFMRRETSKLMGIALLFIMLILNLAIWFGLHVLFREVGKRRLGPLEFTWPDLASLDLGAAGLAALAMLALFRFRLGMVPTLALCGGLGYGLRLAFP